ncbi:MAG: hypothetical protein EOO06_05500 [Chitinophagaceae bacterium]|nr:MAG: hypothetical protein EOO06_05500 [Chitinophagaceae bacterium]
MAHFQLPTRIVVHARDVENITGYMPRTARKLLQKIRKTFGKPPGAMVTVKEFSAYTGLEESLITSFLRL